MSNEGVDRPVALVTGASRGIGRASALRLADVGFDVVLTGRSVEGPIAHGGHALHGSLREVEAEVSQRGAKAVVAQIDLLDLGTIGSAVEAGLDRFGHIDAVVHSATHIAEGNADNLLDMQISSLDESLRANVVGSTRLFQAVLPNMLDRGAGVWISLVSGAAVLDPPRRANEGGWSFVYGAQKAGLYRLAGVANTEFGRQGIRAYNLQPGIVATEVLRKSLGSDGPLEAEWGAAPPEVPAAVIEWLITQDQEGSRLGKGVNAQKLCAELGLVEGWSFPGSAG